MSKAAAEGARAAGAAVEVLQVPELLPAEVLEKMHAPPKPADVPLANFAFVQTMSSYDGERSRWPLPRSHARSFAVAHRARRAQPSAARALLNCGTAAAAPHHQASSLASPPATA